MLSRMLRLLPVFFGMYEGQFQTMGGEQCGGDDAETTFGFADVPDVDVLVETFDDNGAFLNYLTQFEGAGTVTKFHWKPFSDDAGGVIFQVLRPVEGDHYYSLVAEEYCEASSHDECIVSLMVRAGDRIGWRFPDAVPAFGHSYHPEQWPFGLHGLSFRRSVTSTGFDLAQASAGPVNLGDISQYGSPQHYQMFHFAGTFVCDPDAEIETTTPFEPPAECIQEDCLQGCLRDNSYCMMSRALGAPLYTASECLEESDPEGITHTWCGEVQVPEVPDVSCVEGWMVCPIDVEFYEFDYVADISHNKERYDVDSDYFNKGAIGDRGPINDACLDEGNSGELRTFLNFPWQQCGGKVNPGADGTATISMTVHPIMKFWVIGPVPGPVECRCTFDLKNRVFDDQDHLRRQERLKIHEKTVDGVTFAAYIKMINYNDTNEIGRIVLNATARLPNPKFNWCRGIIVDRNGPPAPIWTNRKKDPTFGWKLNPEISMSDDQFSVILEFDSFYSRESATIRFECEVEQELGRRRLRSLSEDVVNEDGEVDGPKKITFDVTLEPEQGAGKSFEDLRDSRSTMATTTTTTTTTATTTTTLVEEEGGESVVPEGTPGSITTEREQSGESDSGEDITENTDGTIRPAFGWTSLALASLGLFMLS